MVLVDIETTEGICCRGCRGIVPEVPRSSWTFLKQSNPISEGQNESEPKKAGQMGLAAPCMVADIVPWRCRRCAVARDSRRCPRISPCPTCINQDMRRRQTDPFSGWLVGFERCVCWILLVLLLMMVN